MEHDFVRQQPCLYILEFAGVRNVRLAAREHRCDLVLQSQNAVFGRRIKRVRLRDLVKRMTEASISMTLIFSRTRLNFVVMKSL